MPAKTKLTNAKKTALLKKLGRAIVKVVPDADDPIVRNERPTYGGKARPVLLWEGLFEWSISVSMYESIYAGEYGRYGTPVEPTIKEVINEIEKAGGFLEPENHYTMTIGDA